MSNERFNLYSADGQFALGTYIDNKTQEQKAAIVFVPRDQALIDFLYIPAIADIRSNEQPQAKDE